MHYDRVSTGTFIRRINRFTAQAELNGETVFCHVKNTGRLSELLKPGVPAALQFSDSPGRKTSWDLIAVFTSGVWVNIDSQAPNELYAEWAVKNGLTLFRREVTWKDSRFDFLFGESHYVEVKGVTLVDEGTALFPDAPTLRGEKHLQHLTELSRAGAGASVVFVVTHPLARRAAPHPDRPVFLQALGAAHAAGVRIRACLCDVTKDDIGIVRKIPFLIP